MRVLIDGHNAIFRLGLSGRSHAALRAMLLDRVRFQASNAVTVVFDARHAGAKGPRASTHEGIHLRWAHSRTADDEILQVLSRERDRASVLVVTDDLELRARVERLGGRWQAVADYFCDAPPEAYSTPTGNRPPWDNLSSRDFGLPDQIDLDDPALR